MSLVSRNALLISMLSCCLLFAESGADSPTTGLVKFLPDNAIPNDVLRAFVDARHIGEYRVVEIDTNALRLMIREAHASASPSVTPTILFPLVDESVVSIELRTSDEHHDGWQSGIATFIGRIAGDEYSSTQCVIGPDGSVDLVIRVPGKRYKLEKTPLLPFHVYWTLGDGFKQKID